MTDVFRGFMAPFTAFCIIMGGGVFLYFTFDNQAAANAHLIVSGLMGSAATFLFGDAAQRRMNDSQPTVTTTAGPPARTTVTPANTESPTLDVQNHLGN